MLPEWDFFLILCFQNTVDTHGHAVNIGEGRLVLLAHVLHKLIIRVLANFPVRVTLRKNAFDCEWSVFSKSRVRQLLLVRLRRQVSVRIELCRRYVGH